MKKMNRLDFLLLEGDEKAKAVSSKKKNRVDLLFEEDFEKKLRWIEEEDLRLDIHSRYCCYKCGCEFGSLYCPVTTGKVGQYYQCGIAFTCPWY